MQRSPPLVVMDVKISSMSHQQLNYLKIIIDTTLREHTHTHTHVSYAYMYTYSIQYMYVYMYRYIICIYVRVYKCIYCIALHF